MITILSCKQHRTIISDLYCKENALITFNTPALSATKTIAVHLECRLTRIS